MTTKKKYGLVGRNINYSFSRTHFTKKFEIEALEGSTYENFDIQDISEFPNIIQNNPNLKGLNVTIPYKEAVIPYLDKMSKKAKKMGAVNTIRFTKKGKLKGYNTDYYGFQKALEPLLEPQHQNALILGTGGASKAVAFALEQLGIGYTFVSREAKDKTIDYNSLNAYTFHENQIIINCTPLGTTPNTQFCPDIPYDSFTPDHIAFDLIYNPAETLFLQKAKEKGATIKNGMQMLELQAEEAWRIWGKSF
jgi:shikimate dehydrogenase